MLTIFPRYFSVRAIICYLITLALVSSIFISYALPFHFMLFGIIPVCLFFLYANKLTVNWERYLPNFFAKRLFINALVIRIVVAIFLYFYFIAMTGEPFMYHTADELFYDEVARVLPEYGWNAFIDELFYFAGFSDRGYPMWLALEYFVLGTNVLGPRIIKCFLDAFACVLIYNLGKRNFGESTGRIAGIFYMLMPNMLYYCGITLKECEMAFLVILFVERADLALRAPKITFKNIILPGLIILAMFTFRTALAGVLIAALAGALILSSGKQLQLWKKIVYIIVFSGWMFLTVGVEMIQDAQELWDARTENQSVGYAAKAKGNTFFQYATSATLAPLIFTIPLSTMVHIPYQEPQMMLHGGNFVKNVLSGLTIFSLAFLLIKGEWRKHVLPLAVMCGYLLVIVFSTFAHSERFHYPVLGLELMFAAAGISYLSNKHKRWFVLWLCFVCIANVIWAWIKLRGRGWI